MTSFTQSYNSSAQTIISDSLIAAERPKAIIFVTLLKELYKTEGQKLDTNLIYFEYD